MGKTFRRRPGDDEYDYFKRRKKFEHRRRKRIDTFNKKFVNLNPGEKETEKQGNQ